MTSSAPATALARKTVLVEGQWANHKAHGLVRLLMHDGLLAYQRLGHAGVGDDLDALEPVVFRANSTYDQMPCLQLKNPPREVRAFLAYCTGPIAKMSEAAHEVRNRSYALMTHNRPEHVLIEFWNKDFQCFIDHANIQFGPWIERAMENGTLEQLMGNLPD